jgi:hypothetical protein
MRASVLVVAAAFVAVASASIIWNDFTTPFHDDFTAYRCVGCAGMGVSVSSCVPSLPSYLRL